MRVDPTATGVAVELRGERDELTRAQARALRDALAAALTDRRTFVHTVGVHREDGGYVVERRGADSAGHRKVFDSFAELERLYDRIPRRFTAEDVGSPGLSGGRRHMVVRHLAEHPAFDCELASRQPLTVEKRDAEDPARDRPVTTGHCEEHRTCGDPVDVDPPDPGEVSGRGD